MSRSNEFDKLFPVLGRISRLFNRLLTGRGKVLLAATLFFLVGSIHVDSPIYYLCGASLSTLVVAFVGSRYFRPELACSVSVPSVVTVGIPFSAKVNVQNGGHDGFDLQFRWSPNRSESKRFKISDEGVISIDEIRSGQLATVSLPLCALQRGAYPCPTLQATSSFPFDLFLLSESFLTPAPLLVAPAFKPLVSGGFLANYLAQQAGEARRNASLGEQEFVGSREYAPGVPGRRWDYRAWARTGKPHLRQHEGHGSKRVFVFVDTVQTQPDAAKFEAQMSLATAIVDYLLRYSGQLLGGFAISHRQVRIPANHPEGQFAKICRQLATAEPTSVPEHPLLLPVDVAPCLIFVTAEYGAYQQSLVEQYRSTGHTVLPIVVCGETAPGADEIRNRPSDWKLVSTAEIESGVASL